MVKTLVPWEPLLRWGVEKWAARVKYTICRAKLFSIASILSLSLVTFLEKMKIPGDSKGMPRER